MISSLSISSLKTYLNKVLPTGWENFELETILMELGVEYSSLLSDKINVVRLFKVAPDLFYNEVMVFMHVCDVINGNAADFDSIPHLTSLEAAYGIYEASRTLGLDSVEQSPAFSEGVREVIKHILINDGYSNPVWPFDSVGVTGLSEGVSAEDMARKSAAIKEYISGISSKSSG